MEFPVQPHNYSVYMYNCGISSFCGSFPVHGVHSVANFHSAGYRPHEIIVNI